MDLDEYIIRTECCWNLFGDLLECGGCGAHGATEGFVGFREGCHFEVYNLPSTVCRIRCFEYPRCSSMQARVSIIYSENFQIACH